MTLSGGDRYFNFIEDLEDLIIIIKFQLIDKSTNTNYARAVNPGRHLGSLSVPWRSL